MFFSGSECCNPNGDYCIPEVTSWDRQLIPPSGGENRQGPHGSVRDMESLNMSSPCFLGRHHFPNSTYRHRRSCSLPTPTKRSVSAVPTFLSSVPPRCLWLCQPCQRLSFDSLIPTQGVQLPRLDVILFPSLMSYDLIVVRHVERENRIGLWGSSFRLGTLQSHSSKVAIGGDTGWSSEWSWELWQLWWQ